jgi:hypothetical protein
MQAIEPQFDLSWPLIRIGFALRMPTGTAPGTGLLVMDEKGVGY